MNTIKKRFGTFFSTIRDVFNLKELRERLLYTLFFVGIYRLGVRLILPGFDASVVTAARSTEGIKAMLDTLLGGALRTNSVFALGIMPYISASIMMQIASLNIAYVQRLQKEGAAGRAKKTQITRILTLFLALAQGLPLLREAFLTKKEYILVGPYFFYIVGVLLLATGTMFSLWLSDRITEKGIGNGSSVLIMSGIIASLPEGFLQELTSRFKVGQQLFFVIELTLIFFIVLAIIAFTQGKRKIYLQYARQMTLSNMPVRQKNRPHLPVKVNSSGVMPAIFAGMVLAGILFVARLFQERIDFAAWVVKKVNNPYTFSFNVGQSILIFIGTFLYTTIFTNPVEISDELKRNNGFIPGIKPGKDTARYIDEVIGRVTLPGALFLAVIAVLPALAIYARVDKTFSRFCGGTSMIILVGVLIDMVQQIQSYLFMRYYDRMMRDSSSIPV